MIGYCNGCLTGGRALDHGSICLECASAARAWILSGTTERIAAAVGARLKQLRVARGLSQGDVAKATGIWRPIVSRIERGVHLPSVTTVCRFAEAIGVDPLADVLAVLDDVLGVGARKEAA